MDKIGLLHLDKNGINRVHKMYIEANNKNLYFPTVKSLVMENIFNCDYCDTSMFNSQTDKTHSIQFRLNYGVQICHCCLSEHRHHLTFIQKTIQENTMSWWQFKSICGENDFIKNLDPLTPIGMGYCESPLPPFDYIYVDVKRAIKIDIFRQRSRRGSFDSWYSSNSPGTEADSFRSTGVSVTNLRLPIVFGCEREISETAKQAGKIYVTNRNYINLDSFIKLGDGIDREQITDNIEYYMNVKT